RLGRTVFCPRISSCGGAALELALADPLEGTDGVVERVAAVASGRIAPGSGEVFSAGFGPLFEAMKKDLRPIEAQIVGVLRIGEMLEVEGVEAGGAFEERGLVVALG